MQSTTACKRRQLPAQGVIVGVDPHKRVHAVVVVDAQGSVSGRFKVANSAQGYAQLLQRARAAASTAGTGGPIFAIEAGGHYWRNLAYHLEEKGLVWRLINPFTLKRQREGEDLNRHKTDYRDALMAAELLADGRFTQAQLPQGVYADLRATYGAYRRLHKEYGRSRNLVRALLDGLFPEFCAVFKDPCAQSASAVLLTCALPAQIARLGVGEFIARVRQAQVGRRLAVKKLARLHALASTSVGVKAGALGVAQEIGLLVARQRLLADQLVSLEGRLRELVAAAEENRYLLSVPGLSPLLVAGLLAETGPLRAYADAKALVKLAGTNPSCSQSAGKGRQHTPITKKGRAGLRCCLWQAALGLLRNNAEFRRWAQQLQNRPADANPLHRREVLGAAMNKLLRLCYALVSHRCLYQPQGVRRAAA